MRLIKNCAAAGGLSLLGLIGSLAATAATATAPTPTMSRGERAGHERQIAADYKADKARCSLLGGSQTAGCLDKAKISNRLALAELAYNASGSQMDAGRLAVAKSDADYAFAKDRCEARSNVDREACIREAKAAHARASAGGH